MTHSAIGEVQWNRDADLPTPSDIQEDQVKVALANSSAEGISAMAYEAMIAAQVRSGAKVAGAGSHAVRFSALSRRTRRVAFAGGPNQTRFVSDR